MIIEENAKRTELSELGEFGLIDHITKNFKLKHTSSVKGVGDDAAVINAEGKHQVVTTDLLVEGIHFDLMYTPLKHLGYKAVVVNLSDVYAMNAEPKQITVSIAMSSKMSVEMVEELYSGIKLACETYNVDLIGGDTSSSVTGLLISVTAIGEADKDAITYRNTAKKNDVLCVSGDLGGSYMGLQLLEREKEVFKVNPNAQPDFSGCDYIIERQLKPEARKDIVALLKEKNIVPTAMIDISDGLSSETIHICSKSDVGACIYEEKIPIDQETVSMAEEFNMDPTIAAMSGGEDYELLFTIDIRDFEKLKDTPGISFIGHITDKAEGISLIARDGSSVPVSSQGWDAVAEH